MDNGFPKELLFQSVEDRIKYFEKKTVAHPKLVNSYNDLMDKIKVANKDKVLLVYGPSGVGKSTLFKRIKNDYVKRYHNEMEKDKGMIPVLAIETFAPEDGKFDWIDFYSESLKGLQDVLIDEKILTLNGHRSSLGEMGVSIPNPLC